MLPSPRISQTPVEVARNRAEKNLSKYILLVTPKGKIKMICLKQLELPIPSHGIFTYIYHKKLTIHVGKYTIYMDGMGYEIGRPCLLTHLQWLCIPRDPGSTSKKGFISC